MSSSHPARQPSKTLPTQRPFFWPEGGQPQDELIAPDPSAKPSSANPTAPLPEAGRDEQDAHFSESDDEEPDWHADSSLMADGLGEEAGVVQSASFVEEELGRDCITDVLDDRARREETAEVLAALTAPELPAFLRAASDQGVPGNRRMDEVQAMKKRGIEHVRDRRAEIPRLDRPFESQAHAKRCKA